MVGVEIKFDASKIKKIQTALDGVGLKKKSDALSQSFRVAGIFLEARLKEKVGGDILNVRSGVLRNSIGSKVFFKSAKDISVVVGSGVRSGARTKYANIHEVGGTIVPVNKQWLTIPFPAALTSAGVLRASARQWENTFIAKHIIFQKRGKTIVPLFALKKSVKIPARRYMNKTLTEHGGKVFGIIMDSIKKQIAKAV